MTRNIITVLITLFWSLFFGITIVAIGFGAIYPPINNIAGPFVCPGGSLQTEEETYHPAPGETVTTITWLCVDGKTGAAHVLEGLGPNLIAGTIYGLITFVPVIIIVFIWRTRRKPLKQSYYERRNQEVNQATVERVRANELNSRFPQGGAGEIQIANELKQLKELRDSDLITAEDYEKKKAEILSRL